MLAVCGRGLLLPREGPSEDETVEEEAQSRFAMFMREWLLLFLLSMDDASLWVLSLLLLLSMGRR